MGHLFRNDYSELCHINILKALENAYDIQNIGYGLDDYSLKAQERIKEVFNCKESEVHFLVGGTQTNMTVISYILRDYEAVIAVDGGHINVHETGSVESTGHKIYTVKGMNGKVTVDDVLEAININHNEHTVKIRMVYISNATEIGTIYSKDELSKLYKVCKENDLYLFMDGARLGTALTSDENDIDVKEIASLCDVFYIGGTKNGLMAGEAVVINNKELFGYFRHQIKNKGAMLAKGFFLGIQFDEAFKNNLYFEIAKHTNEMASIIKKELLNLGFCVSPSPTNQLFVTLPIDKAQKVMDEFGCELWIDGKETMVIRIVTSFNTTKSDVKEIVTFFKNL